MLVVISPASTSGYDDTGTAVFARFELLSQGGCSPEERFGEEADVKGDGSPLEVFEK